MRKTIIKTEILKRDGSIVKRFSPVSEVGTGIISIATIAKIVGLFIAEIDPTAIVISGSEFDKDGERGFEVSGESHVMFVVFSEIE